MTLAVAVLAAAIASPAIAAGRAIPPHDLLAMQRISEPQREFFTALQRQGAPSRQVVFPDDGHWILKPDNSLFWYRQVLEWVRDHL